MTIQVFGPEPELVTKLGLPQPFKKVLIVSLGSIVTGPAPPVPPSDSSATPSASPSSAPSASAFSNPSQAPASFLTTDELMLMPSPLLSALPTPAPSTGPTLVPTLVPVPDATPLPTSQPSQGPTKLPTALPTPLLTALPTDPPTLRPTEAPSSAPSLVASNSPSTAPTSSPTMEFDGHGVPLTGDWDNQRVVGDNTGRYFLFRPEHWEAVFGSLPPALSYMTYSVEQRQDDQVVWQGTLRMWIWDSTEPDIGLPDGFEHGRRHSNGTTYLWAW
ncbi:unnamed protein product [Cylindrotheca closterium]|uniref:Uncharacterized protein n=1 Tax=Cylindrotheca closterium TaxID=2856 RepID=A0AAD2JK99_9STRA|nr:unnamed protein product [Cylindrotheca closterium]